MSHSRAGKRVGRCGSCTAVQSTGSAQRLYSCTAVWRLYSCTAVQSTRSARSTQPLACPYRHAARTHPYSHTAQPSTPTREGPLCPRRLPSPPEPAEGADQEATFRYWLEAAWRLAASKQTCNSVDRFLGTRRRPPSPPPPLPPRAPHRPAANLYVQRAALRRAARRAADRVHKGAQVVLREPTGGGGRAVVACGGGEWGERGSAPGGQIRAVGQSDM